MNYIVIGAYKLPRKNGIIDSSNSAKRKFWEYVEEDKEGLPSACGCYVFSAQNRPWYIGMAQKQKFTNECLTDHKINIYNNILTSYKRAAPWLYFIAKLTPSGKFSAPSKKGQKDIEDLENILIGLAISRNPQLFNIRGTKLLRDMCVPGIMNTKKGQGRAYAVQEIRSLFGIKQ